MFPSLRFHSIATVFALAFVIDQSPSSVVVMANFSTCLVDSAYPDSTVCVWSEIPLVLGETAGGELILIENSQLFAVCGTGGAYDISNCVCGINILDNAVYDPNKDVCTSCTLLSITEFSFLIHYDCSNKATGNCPIYNANGCQSSFAVTTGVPTPATVVTVPSPVSMPQQVNEPTTTTGTAPSSPVTVSTPVFAPQQVVGNDGGGATPQSPVVVGTSPTNSNAKGVTSSGCSMYANSMGIISGTMFITTTMTFVFYHYMGM